MSWAQVRHDGTIFQVRVAGVASSAGRVLLHRTAGEEIWSLPGGRLQVQETLSEALQREMHEEAGVEVEVGGVLWLVENFFEHWPLDGSAHVGEGRAFHHEIGLYLEMFLPPHLEEVGSFEGAELDGSTEPFALEFRWVPRAEVGSLDVRPAALGERLANTLPSGVPSICNTEVDRRHRR